MQPKHGHHNETDVYVATVQEGNEECWPEENVHGNLEKSPGISDSYNESINDELEFEDTYTNDVNDDVTVGTFDCGLDMSNEDLQVTADIEKSIYRLLIACC